MLKKSTIRGVCILFIAFCLITLVFLSIPNQNQQLTSSQSSFNLQTECSSLGISDTLRDVLHCPPVNGTTVSIVTTTVTTTPKQGLLPLWSVGLVVVVMVVFTIILYVKASRVKLPKPTSETQNASA